MSEIKVEKLKAEKAGKRPKTVGMKTIINDEGGKSRVYTVSSNSPSRSTDLLYVFKKSVEKAREENLKILGSRSGK